MLRRQVIDLYNLSKAASECPVAPVQPCCQTYRWLLEVLHRQ